jgi:hypothetical protein
MKILALILLLAWPWGAHVEKGKAVIGPDGVANVKFKKVFSVMPACTVSIGKVRSWSRESAELLGNPGDTVEWSCK